MKNRKFLIAALTAVFALPVLASCDKVDKKLIGKYTLRESESGSPETWNVHTWETTTDSVIMGYTEMGLFDFVYNKDEVTGEEGYKIVPEMAAELAQKQELTQEEFEKYGYELVNDAYPTGVKWVINLNQAAQWEDGTPINADTYIDSMHKLLDPDMQNRRADSYFTGDAVIRYAKNYFNYNNPYQYTAVKSGDDVDENTYLDMDGSWGLKGAKDADGNVCPQYLLVTDETLWRDPAVEEGQEGDWISAKQIYDGYFAPGQQYAAYVTQVCFTRSGLEPKPFEDVGIKKTGEYQITIFLDHAVTDFFFYYGFSGNWIVHKDVYERTLATPEGATLKATQYGTKAEEYVAYGPYKLVSYQLDKQIVLTRNEKWYGWTDGKHVGQFQTTDVVIDIVPEPETQLLMFEKGQLDSVALQGSDMEKYGNSSGLVYTPQSYTSKVTLNSDFAKLKENQENKETANPGKQYNKTVLANIKFREAISWSLNRLDFVQSMTAGSGVGLGLINDAYIADVDTGTTYRSSEAGKQVFKNVYGDSETGYDEAKAIALFDAAYDEEFASPEEGSLEANDIVSILWEVFNDGWMDYINYYVDNIKTALQKSKFGTNTDGITFEIVTSVTGNAYSDHISDGSCEMGMSTWGGAAMDPLGIMEVYDNKDLAYEPGFDGTKLNVTVQLASGEETHTFHEWVELSATRFSPSNGSVEDRVAITAALEEAYLKTWNVVSIYTRQSVSMNSFKVKMITDNYNQFYGYGGIRFMTYNYDDYDWAKLCKDSKNLDYTR